MVVTLGAVVGVTMVVVPPLLTVPLVWFSFFVVAEPMMPSAFRPLARWKAISARLVWLPNLPSALPVR